MSPDHPIGVPLPPTNTPPHQGRALLVDDVVYNLEWLSEILRSLGFDSTFASNIAEAKTALAHPSFDVLFLDEELPDGTGCVLAMEIREMGLESAPAIIGMTSSDDKDMILHYLSAGAGAFIQKPISFDLVYESLCKCKLIPTDKPFEKPVRSKLSFSNIHLMSRGDSDRFLSYVERIQAQLETEVSLLVIACYKGEPTVARAIVHRLLSLTPLLESPEFTSALQSCQRVARWHDLKLLRELGQAVEWEYSLVKTSLKDEIELHQHSRSPWLCRTA